MTSLYRAFAALLFASISSTAVAADHGVCLLDGDLESRKVCDGEDIKQAVHVGIFLPGEEACSTPDTSKEAVQTCLEEGYYYTTLEELRYEDGPDGKTCKTVTSAGGCTPDDGPMEDGQSWTAWMIVCRATGHSWSWCMGNNPEDPNDPPPADDVFLEE
jgi:hypothetical protein